MFAIFENGSSRRTVETNKGFWDMISANCVEQVDETTYRVLGKAQILSVKKLSVREKAKAILRNFATEWQYNFASMDYSVGELCDYQNFFEEYGRKYGLLKEFYENGVC